MSMAVPSARALDWRQVLASASAQVKRANPDPETEPMSASR
jgi:hypothetical protein